MDMTTTGRVNVPGAALEFRLDGPLDAPVLMLGNSLAADLSMWDDNVPALAARFRVLRYDMRGHGRSSTPPGAYTMRGLADDAIALLDTLGFEQVHFVGLSLGGMVGQQLGARYGARLHSLVLCDTLASQGAAAAWDERIGAVQARGMAAVVDATLERWFTAPFREREPAALQRVREMILATSVNGYAGAAAAVRDLRQTAMLSSITVPTLVLTGAQDPAATPDIARAIQAQVRGSKLVLIEDAAHLPNIEQARAFEDAVLAFLGGLSPMG